MVNQGLGGGEKPISFIFLSSRIQSMDKKTHKHKPMLFSFFFLVRLLKHSYPYRTLPISPLSTRLCGSSAWQTMICFCCWLSLALMAFLVFCFGSKLTLIDVRHNSPHQFFYQLWGGWGEFKVILLIFLSVSHFLILRSRCRGRHVFSTQAIRA